MEIPRTMARDLLSRLRKHLKNQAADVRINQIRIQK